MYSDEKMVIDGMDFADNCEKSLKLCLSFLEEKRQRFTTCHLPGGEQKKSLLLEGSNTIGVELLKNWVTIFSNAAGFAN
jgi:hypothetical protein